MIRRCLCLAVLAACRKAPAPPPTVPVPDLPPLPELALAYRDQVDRTPPDKADGPAKSRLRWKLAGTHVYKVDQTVMTGSVAEGARSYSAIRGDGILEIVDAAARYKMTLKESVVDGVRQDVNQQPAAKIEFRLDEEGRFRETKTHSGGDSQMTEFLFGLPIEELEPGRPVERKYVNFGTYAQAGTVKSTLTGYALLQGRVCARIETEHRLDLRPAQDDGSGKGKMASLTVAYFAVEEGRFVLAESAVSFVYSTRQKISKAGEPDRWSTGTLESHTILRARLQ